MAIKLIGVDIDGTLLNSQKALTPATREAIAQASRQGVEVVISTGRFLSEYQALLAELPTMTYTVSCTGAQVLNLCTGETLFRRGLTAPELRRLYGKIRDLDAMPQIFSDKDGKIHNRARDLAQAERFCGSALVPLLQATHVPEEDLDAFVSAYTGMTNKIHIFFPDEDNLQEARRRLSDEPYTLLSSGNDDLEVMARGVDKGLGMQMLAEHLGLSRQEVMTIGDGDNDIAMLRYAGLGLAMKNASEGAKAAANEVLPYTNDEDGVAKAILSVL